MLEVKDVSVSYGQGLFSARKKQVLSGVSFTLACGESLGVVGKSGSGKTTIANAILGLAPVRAGEVLLNGKPVRTGYTRRALARQIQLVTQNPETSFDPDRTIAESFKEVLRIHRLPPKGAALEERARPLLADVGLENADLAKPPRRFSGGELQRLSIVRALLLSPRVLLFDEADSMLDTALRLRLFDTLNRLREKYALSYLYITHDIRVLPHLADKVLVLAQGKVAEYGPVELLRQSGGRFVQELRDAMVVELCARATA